MDLGSRELTLAAAESEACEAFRKSEWVRVPNWLEQIGAHCHVRVAVRPTHRMKELSPNTKH